MLTFYQSLAVAQRILQELIIRKRSLVFWLVFPLTILFVNGYIVSERAKINLSLAFKISAPSAVVVALFFSCLGGPVATIVREREQKTLKRLFLSPLNGFGYFLGILIAYSSLALCQTLILYLPVFLIVKNLELSLTPGIIILFLGIIVYVGLGIVLGSNLAKRTEDVNAVLATFGVPLLILGGTFFPSFIFPKKMLAIAKFNPIFHLNEALVKCWGKGGLLEDILVHLWFLLFFALIVTLLGWWCYGKMIQSETRL